MELSETVALVTGGGGPGIGRAISRRLAAEGCRVVVSDVQDEGGRESVRAIVAAGGTAEFVHADSGSEDDVRRLVETCIGLYGGLDILVNNASAPYRPGEPYGYWNQITSVDLLGTMWAILYSIPYMKQRGGGSVVNISSTSAIGHGRKHSGSPAYDVAKAGVLRLTTLLSGLHNEANIRVNCIAPDWVATPEVLDYWNSRTPEQRRAEGTPSRLTTLGEITDAILRLVGDDRLFGRVAVWWSDDDAPGLIAEEDYGYGRLEAWPP